MVNDEIWEGGVPVLGAIDLDVDALSGSFLESSEEISLSSASDSEKAETLVSYKKG